MPYCVRAWREQVWAGCEAEKAQGSNSPGEGRGWPGLESPAETDGVGWGTVNAGCGCGGGALGPGSAPLRGEWATLEKGAWASGMGLPRTVSTPGLWPSKAFPIVLVWSLADAG